MVAAPWTGCSPYQGITSRSPMPTPSPSPRRRPRHGPAPGSAPGRFGRAERRESARAVPDRWPRARNRRGDRGILFAGVADRNAPPSSRRSRCGRSTAAGPGDREPSPGPGTARLPGGGRRLAPGGSVALVGGPATGPVSGRSRHRRRNRGGTRRVLHQPLTATAPGGVRGTSSTSGLPQQRGRVRVPGGLPHPAGMTARSWAGSWWPRPCWRCANPVAHRPPHPAAGARGQGGRTPRQGDLAGAAFD
jgi:hypothetical protein